MAKDTIKGRVNAKWSSSEEFRSAFDRIFGNKSSIPCGDLESDKRKAGEPSLAEPCATEPEQEQNNSTAEEN